MCNDYLVTMHIYKIKGGLIHFSKISILHIRSYRRINSNLQVTVQMSIIIVRLQLHIHTCTFTVYLYEYPHLFDIMSTPPPPPPAPPKAFPYDHLFKLLMIGDAGVGKVRS